MRAYQRFWVISFNAILWALPLMLVAMDAYARAGGGRNAKCHSLWCMLLYPIAFAISLFAGTMLSWKHYRVNQALRKMQQHEPQWSPEQLQRIAREQFMLIQELWSQQDVAGLKSHLHPRLLASWESQIKDLQVMGETNRIRGLSINRVRIVDARNYRNDDWDEFTVAFDASGTDETLREGRVVEKGDDKFREFWTFAWYEQRWVLREVTQAQGWRRFVASRTVHEQ